MNSKIFYFVLFSALVMYMEACNSTPYEIVEIEDVPDTVKTSKDYTEIKKELNEPKQELKDEITNNGNKVTESTQTKETTESSKTSYSTGINKDQSSSNFAVQIGAFSSERNADRFTSRATNKMQYDFYNLYSDGLYKVRFGNFSTNMDAKAELSKLKEAGFWDSFVVEIKK